MNTTTTTSPAVAPGVAPPDLRRWLLQVEPEPRIASVAQARNAYGTAAQEIICALLDLLPVPINGSYELCLDAVSSDLSRWFEIKSVHVSSGKLVLYDWRLRKEQRSELDITYAVLLHKIRGHRGSGLFAAFASGGLTLLLVPGSVVWKLAPGYPLTFPKPGSCPRDGFARAGYAQGYRNVRVRDLLDLACPAEMLKTKLYEHEIVAQVLKV